jgi:hypothetical protein
MLNMLIRIVDRGAGDIGHVARIRGRDVSIGRRNPRNLGLFLSREPPAR